MLDVTDPAKPKVLHHLPAGSGGAQMVRVCSAPRRGDEQRRSRRPRLHLIVDRHGLGLHILELTGDARQAANYR